MFFAMTNAIFDAGIAAWTAKRTYDSVRPVTAIDFLFQGQQIMAWGGPYRGTVLDVSFLQKTDPHVGGNGFQRSEYSRWYGDAFAEPPPAALAGTGTAGGSFVGMVHSVSGASTSPANSVLGLISALDAVFLRAGVLFPLTSTG